MFAVLVTCLMSFFCISLFHRLGGGGCLFVVASLVLLLFWGRFLLLFFCCCLSYFVAVLGVGVEVVVCSVCDFALILVARHAFGGISFSLFFLNLTLSLTLLFLLTIFIQFLIVT